MIKKSILLAAIWFTLSIESKASQEQISGSNLANLIIERLNKEGFGSEPVIALGLGPFFAEPEEALVEGQDLGPR